ncbi:hypothetical protein SESBI_03970 [Sesbania bispinosa]|nr:hypothetical protein SESBI_03970 [Sesbania bispinosa]
MQLVKPSQQSDIVIKNFPIPQPASHGIKTTLNVDILSKNRMRFRDDDDPPILSSPKAVVVNEELDKVYDVDAHMGASIEPSS